MRLVVVGAGAIGGSVGALAIRAGFEVVLVARGAHGDAIRQHGLRLDTPDETFVVHAPFAPEWRDDDIVLLAVKTQDVEAAIGGIPPHVPIVCLTNGIAAERIAARAGHPVYGAFVFVPASHLEPGRVQLWAAPVGGVIDVGGYRHTGELAPTISTTLQRAGFASEVRDDIMRYKRGKLLMNLGNAIEALCGSFEGEEEIEDRARAEAIACFEAAGLPYTIDPSRSVEVRQIGGKSRPGGSTWQSLARGKSLEVDHFNGEIVALGAAHGIATPTNAVLQRLAAEAVASGLAAGALPPELLIAAVERG